MEKEIKRISFSALKNWKECPYRHKLIYVDKLPHFEGNEYTAFGTAIHAACEKGIPNTSQNALKVFQVAFDKEMAILKQSGREIDTTLIEQMKLQAVPICEQVLPAVTRHFGSFEVVSVEEELLEDISEFDSYGTKFKGFIDAVIKEIDVKQKPCSSGEHESDCSSNQSKTREFPSAKDKCWAECDL